VAANDWFANDAGQGRAPLRMEDVSPSLGGPIRRDHTFFFLAYERMVLRGPYVWQQPVPALAARQTASAWAQPALDLFPAPNGADLAMAGAMERPQHPAIEPAFGLARMDQAITSRGTFFGGTTIPLRQRIRRRTGEPAGLAVPESDDGIERASGGQGGAGFSGERIAGERSIHLDAGGRVEPAGCALASLTTHFFGASSMRFAGAICDQRSGAGGLRQRGGPPAAPVPASAICLPE